MSRMIPETMLEFDQHGREDFIFQRAEDRTERRLLGVSFQQRQLVVALLYELGPN